MNLLFLLAYMSMNAAAGALETHGRFVPTGTPVVLYSVTSATSSPATAAELTLYQYTLPANTLSAVGDSLYIECASTSTAASGTKNNSAYFGTQLMSAADISSTATMWSTWVRIAYRSSTSLLGMSVRMRDNAFTMAHTASFGDPTVANIINCRGMGLGVAGDVFGMYMKVTYEPAK